MSRGKSMTSGTSAIGSMRLGGRSVAIGSAGLARACCVRFSWQPTQLVVSPGITLTKLCIRLTDRSFSSSATKNSGRRAGTSKYAEPSGSTGTVPRIRASVNVPPQADRLHGAAEVDRLGQRLQDQQLLDLAGPHARHVAARGSRRPGPAARSACQVDARRE